MALRNYREGESRQTGLRGVRAESFGGRMGGGDQKLVLAQLSCWGDLFLVFLVRKPSAHILIMYAWARVVHPERMAEP